MDGDDPDPGAAPADSPDAPGDGGERECPDCGESLPGDARFCPYCATAIDEDGAAVDLSDLDGSDVPGDPATLLETDEAGRRRASGPVRALSGLAVGVPLAPLVLFITGSVVSLTAWTGALVFLGGWLCAAAVLARARVPIEAFAWSLYLVAACTLAVPLAVSAGDAGPAVGPGVDFDLVAGASLLVALASVALGTVVRRQARMRVTGERRGFEELREE